MNKHEKDALLKAGFKIFKNGGKTIAQYGKSRYVITNDISLGNKEYYGYIPATIKKKGRRYVFKTFMFEIFL